MRALNPKMMLIAVLSLYVTLGVIGWAKPPAQSFDATDSLDQPVHLSEPMQDVTTERAFATVLFDTGMSGGIVELGSCHAPAVQLPPVHSFVFSGLTVRQALDLIVTDDRKYRWDSNDRVANLLPVDGIPEVLKITVPHFEIKPDDSVVAAGARLFQTSEVKQALAHDRLIRRRGLELIIGGAPPKIGHRIQMENATVMEILNAIAASSKYPAVWQYTERQGQCQGTYALYWPVGSPITPIGEGK